MANKIKIPITLSLTEGAYNKILEQVDGEGEDAQKVAAFSNEVIGALAKGALLLPEGIVDRLTDIDDSLMEPDAIVEACERGLGVKDGSMVARWKIDPALFEEIRQRSEVLGVTVETAVQEMMDQAVSLGWFWDLEARVKTIFLTRKQDDTLRKIADSLRDVKLQGSEVNSDMLMEMISMLEPGKSELGQEDELAFTD